MRRRRLILILAAFAAFFVAAFSGSAAISESLAEVRYMDVNGGTCEPVVVYEDAKACGSMQAAYAASALGDTVLIQDGLYPAQTVGANVSKGQPDELLPVIHFQGGPGARFAAVAFYAPHVRLSGVEVNGMLTARYKPEDPSLQASGNAHFDNVRVVDGGRVTFAAVKNFSFTDSLCADNGKDCVNIYGTDTGAGDVGHYPENGLVARNVIRDLWCCEKTGDHIDAIQFTTGINVAIEDNQIGPNVYHQGLLAKTDKGPITGIRVEGNEFFDVTNPGFSLMFHKFSGRDCHTIEILGNVFHRAPAPRSGPDDQCTGVMSGNTFSSMSANSCAQWLESFEVFDNVFLSGEPCGTVGDPEPPPPPPPPPPDPPPPPPAPECYDGIDNDGDGLIDALDPGCDVEAEPAPPYEPACAPDCDAQIAALTDERDALAAQVASLEAEVAVLEAQVADFEAFVAAYDAWIAEAP